MKNDFLSDFRFCCSRSSRGNDGTYKIRKSRQEIDRLSKQNEQLQQEKAVAQTQVKHFEVRKKNEENTRGSRRDDVINRLQQQGDLRD